MPKPDKSKLEKDCEEILNAFQGILSWKWDSRFDTVLAEFSAEDKENIRAILDKYLKITWNHSNIRNAPAVVKKINSHLGKLRSGQLLFTSDPNRDVVIFCAWWPWGDGKTISLRIASSCKELSASKKAGKNQRTKRWFGL
jgi:hypothetical protein